MLGLQVQLHQPPAQENQADWCTDVDVGIEIAVRTLVARDSVKQALICRWTLTCHSPANALVFAANKTASSITDVSRVPGETVTARASTLRTKAAVNFFFVRRSTPESPGPFGRGCVSEGLENWGRRPEAASVGCVDATLVPKVSYHLAVVALVVLLDSELSEKSSPIGHGRLFPTPFGRASNHHSLDSDSPDMLKSGLLKRITNISWTTEAQPGAMNAVLGSATSVVLRSCFMKSAARVPCLFSSLPARRGIYCVERVWLTWAESSFKYFCVSSCRSRSVLKNSASVVAKDFALMVAVLTCFSSALVFSRASSWHFCSKRRLDSSCRSRAWVRASMGSQAGLHFVFDAEC